MHIRARKHFQYGLLDPQRKEKKIETIYTGKIPTSKRRMGNIFGFYFNSTTSMESKLTIFFGFS